MQRSVCILVRAPGDGVFYCSTAFSETRIPNGGSAGEGTLFVDFLYVDKTVTSFSEKEIFLEGISPPQLGFGILEESSSFPTESRTPLMNCTDSGAENLRATSSASLITTGRGVWCGPSNSATPVRNTLRSTAAMRSMRQCWACF